MKVIATLSVIFLISAVQAYDFEDSIYNQILVNELDDLQWDNNKLLSKINPRNKREVDGKCKNTYFRSCCEEEYFREMYEEDKEMKKECYKEVTGKEPVDSLVDLLKCDKTKEIKRDIKCIAECAARKRGIIDEEGNLKEMETKKSLVEKSAKLEWLAEKIDEIFAKCFAAANEAAKIPKEKGECNPATTKYAHCLWKEIQGKCPADRITDEAKCKKIRESIESLGEYAS